MPGHCHHRSPVRSRIIYGVVVVAMAIGVLTWASLDNTVTVEVDGETRAVSTRADTVGGVLDDIGLAVGEHDTLAPARNVAVKDGARIVLQRGRLLTLKLNGKQRQVWVSARSVDEALAQIGVRAQRGTYLSASRSARLPLDGMAIEVREPVRVRIVVGRKQRTVTTTAATVKDLLAKAKVRLAPADKVSPPLGYYPSSGTVVKVKRAKVEPRQDLRAVARALARRLAPPAPRTPAPTRAPRSDGNHRPSPDGLNWAALAQCESGGNPRAIGGGGKYRGLYQFLLSTWHSVGGSGDPIDASPSEQTYRAQILYRRSGSGQWGACGHTLYS